MSIALLYLACPVIAYVSYINLIATHSVLSSIVISVILAYLPTYAVTNHLSKHGGFQQTWFQKLAYWKRFNRKLLRGELVCEEKLDSKKQYIFGNFPHGTCSVNHVLTMTDCCGMISEHYTGERRDLAASVLFLVPIVKELLLLLGCVDASSPTCHYNLKRGRSILIFVGGEKEQLMTRPGSHKIYLLNRKGFVKLALQYGCDLVPMYAFGENEAYDTSNILEGFRNWLQHNLKLGIPVFFGRRGVPFGLIPKKVPIHLEMGKPIPVKKMDKDAITDKDIDALHSKFVSEMRRLFDRTKVKHGVDAKTELTIL